MIDLNTATTARAEGATADRRRHHRTRHLAAIAVVATALVLAACSSGGSSTATTATGGAAAAGGSAPGAATTITIKNFMYSPMDLTVSPGARVTVVNRDMVTHTVTARSGGFATGDVPPGQSKTFTAPNKAGTYSYYCSIHQYMTGTLTVS